LMLQREVCDRLIATPGVSDYGKLTVTMQLKWDIEKLFDVPPEAFNPQPKVWSSVIRLVPKAAAEDVDQEAFRKLVFAAFSKRRKTLRNALRGLVSEAQFEEAAIDPVARAERLSVSDFVRLTNTL
jgi:16S rRNA (adenine1518-N6/adenine1519-N6)-dimethyltransferase